MNQIFRISILVNAILAVAAVLILRKPAATTNATSSASSTSPTAAAEAPAESPVVSDPALAVVFTTNAFHWRLLEATNYAEFVTNLRDVGCPDRTIRDIIFADAERRYVELQTATAEPMPFWLAGKALVEANRRIENNRTTAQEQLRAELQQLFGVEWNPEEGEIHDIKFQVMSRLVVGPISDEDYEHAWRWLMATVEKGQSFRQQRQNLLFTQDQADWQTIAEGRKRQLEKVFSPVAYEELQARTAFIEEIFSERTINLKHLELTPTELRRVCLAKIREMGWLDEIFRLNRNPSGEEIEPQKISLTAALQSELSPEHFAEFIRVQDDDYRNILDVTRDNDLPRTAAQKIYEVRQLAQTESKRLKAEQSEESAEALATLQILTTDSVRKILGPDAFNKFAARNGQWVTNFTKL